MRKFHKAGLGLALVAMIAAPATADPDDHTNHLGESHDVDERVCNDDGDTITFEGDRRLWPPNHKYSDPYTVVAADEGSMDDLMDVTLTTTVVNDELVDGEELNGSGNTDTDAQPPADGGDPMDGDQDTATTSHQLRSERSGRGDGRVYTIEAVATFDEGMCTQTFEVTVPHDMRNDKGDADRDADRERDDES